MSYTGAYHTAGAWQACVDFHSDGNYCHTY